MENNPNDNIDPVSPTGLRDILKSCTAFSQFSNEDYCVLARHAKREFVPVGTQIVKFGDDLETTMIVDHGRFLVKIPSGTGEDLLIEVDRGQPMGLASMIARETAHGDVYALRDSKIIHISRQAFLECIAKNPELIQGFSKWTVEQALSLVGRNTRKNRPNTFALLPSSDDPKIRGSITFLQQALGEVVGQGHILDSQAAMLSLGLNPSDHSNFEQGRPQLTEWLEEQEAKGNFLLFVCDPTETQWTQWCLNQTSRIFVMVAANDTSRLEYIDSMLSERKIAGSKVLADLLLIQSDEIELPTETSKWTKLKCLARHHHVRYANKRDYQRAARWIGGKPVGLTLGGGGARGLAHVGVLQALEERGVPIDAIGGTSMGAVIAGAYARGWSPQKILNVASNVFTDTKAVLDLNVPFLSILAGRKLNKKLRIFFEDIDIRDLWLSYYCISASLDSGEMIVHDSGSLWKCVRASCSLPGIFPPVRYDDHLLVDGGVMNNVPLDVMESRCKEGTVIAVNVGGGGAKNFASSEHWDSSGWKLLCHKLMNRNENIANILDVMMWSTTLSSKRYLQQLVEAGSGDLYLAPPVQDFQLLGFDVCEKLYRVGYEYACEQLDGWDGLSDIVSAGGPK